MDTVRRLIKTQLSGYWGRIGTRVLMAAVIAATPYAFSFLGKWLVDEALQVTGPPKAAVQDAAQPAAAQEQNAPLRVTWKAKTTEEKLRLLGIFLAVSLALHVLTSGLGAGAEQINSRTVQRMAYDLRTQVHEKLASSDRKFFSGEQVGQLMSRVMDDAGAIPPNLTNLVINTCTQVMMLILGIVLLVRLNPAMTLVAVVALPFYGLTCWLVLPRLRRNTEAIRAGAAGLSGHLVERLSNVTTIKNYSQEEAEINRFSALVDAQLGLARRQNRLNLVFTTLTTLITAVATLSVLLLGFQALQQRRMQLGEVMAFYQVTAQLFVPISALVSMATVTQTLTVLGERVFGILDAPTSVQEARSDVDMRTLQGSVTFDNVSLQYQEGGPFAVRDVSFTIPAGATACIVGPTGCGKSTLITLLTRLYDPTSGTIRLDEHDIRTLPLRDLRRAIGNVLREASVFSGTVAENIAYGVPQAKAQDIEAVARVVGLHELIAGFTKKYDTRVGTGGVTLERDALIKLNVARALITQPTVLTVDDTFAGLEEQTEQQLRQAVARTLHRETVIIATSRLSICEEADMVIVMQKGRVVKIGTHQQLIAQPGLYRRMAMRQMGLAPDA